MIYHKDCEPQIENVPQYNPYKAETEYFARCVEEKAENTVVSDSDVVYVLKILTAIEKSLETGLVQNIE